MKCWSCNQTINQEIEGYHLVDGSPTCCECEDQIMEGSIWKKSKDEIRKIQELRRSNAASPLRDLKKYSRKVKNAKVDPTQEF